jgi:hypothetical protein
MLACPSEYQPVCHEIKFIEVRTVALGLEIINIRIVDSVLNKL